jgi:hypothetical protein
VDWGALLRGELLLTANVALGLALGEAILHFQVADRLFRSMLPRLARWGLSPDLGAALAVSLGSSRAGAAMIAAAFREERLTRRDTVLGTLLLAFPGYLRRWVTSFAVAVGLAGVAGAIYSAVLLLRSAARFVLVLLLLRREKKTLRAMTEVVHGEAAPEMNESSLLNKRKSRFVSAGERRRMLLRLLGRTLPWAWGFYALAFVLVPYLDAFLLKHVHLLPLLPPAGWTVVAGSLAQNNVALAAAKASLATGTLTTAEAVLALLVGNVLGSFSRTARQNVGYWLGLFPRDLVRSLLVWHTGTQIPLMLLSLVGAAIPVLLAR